MKILLIEYSPVITNMITNILTEDNIVKTTNGNIDIPSNTDLIIFDLQLITENILNSKIPSILLCTGQDEIRRIYALEKATAKMNYVVKPFTGEQLKDKINSLFN